MSAQWSMTAHVRESPAGAALHALWAVIHLHCLLQRPAWWRVSANIRCCLVGIKNQWREALTSGGPAGCGGNTLQPTATQWGGLENWMVCSEDYSPIPPAVDANVGQFERTTRLLLMCSATVRPSAEVAAAEPQPSLGSEVTDWWFNPGEGGREERTMWGEVGWTFS